MSRDPLEGYMGIEVALRQLLFPYLTQIEKSVYIETVGKLDIKPATSYHCRNQAYFFHASKLG